MNAETISKMKEMVHANQWISSDEAVNEVGISWISTDNSENKRRDGMRQDVSCIMTMPQVTWLWQCSNSLWKNKFHSCCSYRIWQNLHHYFRLFQRLKMGLQGQYFATLRHLMQREGQPADHTKGGFPQVLPSIAKLFWGEEKEKKKKKRERERECVCARVRVCVRACARLKKD